MDQSNPIPQMNTVNRPLNIPIQPPRQPINRLRPRAEASSRPAVSPAVAAPALDLLPGGPQRAHSEARPEPPPALPRAA